MSSEPVGSVLEMVETRFDEGLLGISSDPSWPAAIFAGTAFVILLLFSLVGTERYRRPRDPKMGWSSPLPGEPSAPGLGLAFTVMLLVEKERPVSGRMKGPCADVLSEQVRRTAEGLLRNAAAGRFLEGFVEASSLAESRFYWRLRGFGTPRRTPTSVLRRPYPLFLLPGCFLQLTSAAISVAAKSGTVIARLPRPRRPGVPRTNCTRARELVGLETILGGWDRACQAGARAHKARCRKAFYRTARGTERPTVENL
jgi:hypothetical protein